MKTCPACGTVCVCGVALRLVQLEAASRLLADAYLGVVDWQDVRDFVLEHGDDDAIADVAPGVGVTRDDS